MKLNSRLIHTFLLVSLAALALTVTSSISLAASDPDVERAKAQIFVQLLANEPEVDSRIAAPEISTSNLVESVRTILAALNTDGSWTDIDYADQTRGEWKSAKHSKRLVELARIYNQPGTPLYHDAALCSGIRLALGNWLQKNYQSTNWWYRDIGTPTAIAFTLMLMEKELTAAEKEACLKIVGRSNISKNATGQNRIWIASNQLRRGLMREDMQAIQFARDVIMEQVEISAVEGLQADFSFHQHGALLQTGNYGLSFVMDIARWADALRGTRWAMPEEKLSILRSYVLEGQRYVYWKQSMDLNSVGRQVFPRSAVGKYQSYIYALQMMQRVDPGHAAEYQAAIQSSATDSVNTFTGNKHFWRSDYMVDRRHNYYASVRMNSARVLAFEASNGENVRGYHTGDGAFYISTQGGEYHEIFPVWDWLKLPGVTAAQIKSPLPVTNPRNKSLLVGGVSDGRDGAAAFECLRGDVTARKSWFFFEGRIVCMGAGISSTNQDAPVCTTLNQSLLRGEVVVQQAGGTPVSVISRNELTNVSWAWHDGIGYYFPTPTKATVGPAPQTGAWQDVYASGSTTPLTHNVFALWLDHGTKPVAAEYAYVILPNLTTKQMAAWSPKPDVKLLSNTPELQAVQSGTLTMAVFYKAGKLTDATGTTLEVNGPCLIMLRQAKIEPILTIADPTQKSTSLNVILNGKAMTCSLPQGTAAGQSTNLSNQD